MNKYILIGYPTCPFVDSTLIVIAERNIDCEIQYIDLKNKPDWFLKSSPTQKVPALKIGDEFLFESSVINEYLNEISNGNLLPEDPLLKANNRAWTLFCSQLIINYYKIIIADAQEEITPLAEKLNEDLLKLEKNHQRNPFFNGNYFSLTDAIYTTFFLRINILEKHYPLNLLADKPVLQNWSQALLEHIAATKALPQNYEQTIIKNIIEKGSYLADRFTPMPA